MLADFHFKARRDNTVPDYLDLCVFSERTARPGKSSGHRLVGKSAARQFEYKGEHTSKYLGNYDAAYFDSCCLSLSTSFNVHVTSA
eukprot:2168047-Pleurochrysis_carterae.AAC.1